MKGKAVAVVFVVKARGDDDDDYDDGLVMLLAEALHVKEFLERS